MCYWITKQLVTAIALRYDGLSIFGTRINRIFISICSFWTRSASAFRLLVSLPQESETNDTHELVHNKQEAFQQAFELVRRYLNENQESRNANYSNKVHGPTCKDGPTVLLYHTAIAVGTTSKIASPWKRPYFIVKCSNEVTVRIKEINSSKQQFVHYDQLKPFFEPPPISNVNTRIKPGNF